MTGQFRFDSGGGPPEADSFGGNNASGLVWQPLPRATFRPLNRPQTPPTPPPVPVPPTPPMPPEPLALRSRESPDEFRGPFNRDTSESVDSASVFNGRSESAPTTPTPALSTSVSTPNSLDNEDQPTRVPLNRFRPTRPPAVDQPSSGFGPTNELSATDDRNPLNSTYRITNECFECICEASTSCNGKSRCQSSDVRHTRCGMFLISYDQWLETNLSKELVTEEALARDAAADERAFYECVTNRDCAERLIAIYMQKNSKDCDKDGRVDCYDVAAIHQGGLKNCHSESLLESQFWNDFNACFGFGR